jgi:hypothetical protein
VLLEAARRLDPPRLRRVVAHHHNDDHASTCPGQGHPTGHDPGGHGDPGGEGSQAERLRTAAALLPPVRVGRRPSRWRWGGPAGSSRPPKEPPWPSATAAGSSPAVRGRWPGAKPTTCATGCMAGGPTFPTWPCCAGPTAGRSMRGWRLARAPRRPPHRHPSPPTTPTTPRRRLTGGKYGTARWCCRLGRDGARRPRERRESVLLPHGRGFAAESPSPTPRIPHQSPGA